MIQVADALCKGSSKVSIRTVDTDVVVTELWLLSVTYMLMSCASHMEQALVTSI